jgi:glutamate formiminotransferase
MPLLAIPNVSEGRDSSSITEMVRAVRSAGGRILDLHSDGAHNRSVLTVSGGDDDLITSMAALALASRRIDLRRQTGAHPRLGSLDVCPIVPQEAPLGDAVSVAHRAGQEIADRANLPVYFYGAAALRPETHELPDLRRGGLARLRERIERDLPPDRGPRSIDDRYGVVCVGARGPLIAFNVWIAADEPTAVELARRVRSTGGGLPGVRALGLPIDAAPTSQVSMNLTDPARTGIDDVFSALQRVAGELGVTIRATEIVGLVPERFLPDPDAQAARLLMSPGRSIEDALRR